LTSDEIEAIIISDFETAFGDKDDVLIKLKATPLDGLHPNYHPRAKISRWDSILTVRADIHVMNPYDPTLDAAIL